jgi:hypothetical protein
MVHYNYNYNLRKKGSGSTLGMERGLEFRVGLSLEMRRLSSIISSSEEGQDKKSLREAV